MVGVAVPKESMGDEEVLDMVIGAEEHSIEDDGSENGRGNAFEKASWAPSVIDL